MFFPKRHFATHDPLSGVGERPRDRLRRLDGTLRFNLSGRPADRRLAPPALS